MPLGVSLSRVVWAVLLREPRRTFRTAKSSASASIYKSFTFTSVHKLFSGFVNQFDLTLSLFGKPVKVGRV
eukprot:310215-Rhodomonas_salina.1